MLKALRANDRARHRYQLKALELVTVLGEPPSPREPFIRHKVTLRRSSGDVHAELLPLLSMFSRQPRTIDKAVLYGFRDLVGCLRNRPPNSTLDLICADASDGEADPTEWPPSVFGAFAQALAATATSPSAAVTTAPRAVRQRNGPETRSRRRSTHSAPLQLTPSPSPSPKMCPSVIDSETAEGVMIDAFKRVIDPVAADFWIRHAPSVIGHPQPELFIAELMTIAAIAHSANPDGQDELDWAPGSNDWSKQLITIYESLERHNAIPRAPRKFIRFGDNPTQPSARMVAEVERTLSQRTVAEAEWEEDIAGTQACACTPPLL